MSPKIYEGDFYKSINDAISDGRHVDYLKEVLKKYAEYKEQFTKLFTDKNSKNSIYLFRVTYLLKRSVWRDIEIFGNQTYFKLAKTIIKSMGWRNDHMHGFDIPERKVKSDPLFTGSSITFFAPGWEDDPHPTYKTDEIRVCDFDYARLPNLKFMFDYGDGHQFDIKFIGIRNAEKKETAAKFPKIIDQRGVGPEQYPEYE